MKSFHGSVHPVSSMCATNPALVTLRNGASLVLEEVVSMLFGIEVSEERFEKIGDKGLGDPKGSPA